MSEGTNMHLSSEEVAALRDVLEAQVAELRMEIAGTDSADFRDGLKRTERVLRRVLERLGQ